MKTNEDLINIRKTLRKKIDLEWKIFEDTKDFIFKNLKRLNEIKDIENFNRYFKLEWFNEKNELDYKWVFELKKNNSIKRRLIYNVFCIENSPFYIDDNTFNFLKFFNNYGKFKIKEIDIEEYNLLKK